MPGLESSTVTVDEVEENTSVAEKKGENGNLVPGPKTEIEAGNKDETEASAANYDLNKFQLQRILNNNTRNKSIALLGSFPDLSASDEAIVVFEKQAFRERDVQTKVADTSKNGCSDTEINNDSVSYFGNDLKVHTEFINNIYGSYQCTPPGTLGGIKATVVYPATEKHIEKYSICQKYVINETPEYYKDVTLPYITSCQFSLEWVYNILEHKQETERIIFEDSDPETGFILLPDLKWDGHNVETLYVLVITHKHDLKSLRDLNSSHLPLLRNIRSRATEAIEKRYGLSRTQLRMYFHYQPSFYHLHVHINPVRNDAPGIWCEKSHMLDTVINNIELLPNYYEKATLPFVLYEGSKLLDLYEAKMPVRKAATKRLAEHLDEENTNKKQKIQSDDDGADVKIAESEETKVVTE